MHIRYHAIAVIIVNEGIDADIIRKKVEERSAEVEKYACNQFVCELLQIEFEKLKLSWEQIG